MSELKTPTNQQVFEFEPKHDYDGDNFLVAPSNKLAFDAAINFPWASYALNIFGERGCGKTHIAQIAESLADKKLTIIDIDAEQDEATLLHTLNIANENDEYALITSESPLTELRFTLPDLTSRLSAISSIAIEKPSEELLYMLLARQFSARQIHVDDNALNYLCSRLERSFAALVNAVEKIDKLSLQEKRSITIPLIKKTINE